MLKIEIWLWELNKTFKVIVSNKCIPFCFLYQCQVYKRNIVNNPLDKAMNTGSGILKKPKAKTEDATYVNIKLPLSSSNRKHPEEPIGALPSSGAVEYATIIFGSKE